MDFVAVVDQAIALLRQRGRVTYRTLQLQFTLDDEQLAALKDELLYSQPHVIDDAGRGLIWTGDPVTTPAATTAPAETPARAPLAYTPPYLAEKILTSRSALEGERKQVTVLFADLKGSMELLADRDPEEARQLLDPVLTLMMDAVHRYERNQAFIPNYGERYRQGERISTGFVESTMNQVISKRMVKKQQMQWSKRGAHLLLQMRTRVLNGEWEATFRTWYPGFRSHAQPVAA